MRPGRPRRAAPRAPWRHRTRPADPNAPALVPRDLDGLARGICVVFFGLRTLAHFVSSCFNTTANEGALRLGGKVRAGLAGFSAALGALVLLRAAPCLSASISHTTTKDGSEIVDLVGLIAPGDSVKLGSVVRALIANGSTILGLRLNSPGGDLNDAFKSVDLVQSANLSTLVPDRATCASACFAIFAAGIQKYASSEAMIGVHGASTKGGDENTSSQAATLRLAKILKTLGVSASVIGKMVVTPPRQVVWLSKTDLESMGVNYLAGEKSVAPRVTAQSQPVVSAQDVSASTVTASEPNSDPHSAEIRAMNWQAADGLKLPNGFAHIYGLQGLQVVVGMEANRYRLLSDPGSLGSIEANAIAGDSTEIVYSWEPSGRVSDDDWSDLDVTQMIGHIRSATLAQNQARKSAGATYFTDVVWREQPRLDRKTHSVSWVIDGTSNDGTHTLNSVTLKLGRYGYERINVLTSSNAPQGASLVSQSNSTFYFDAGARYDDFVDGHDKVAEYGIAGLVASIVGVKVAKVLGFGALLVVMKKFAALSIIPLLIAFRFLKGLFRKSKPKTEVLRVEPRIEPS